MSVARALGTLAAAMMTTTACGGAVASSTSSGVDSATANATPTCVARTDALDSFAVDDAVIWRILADCRAPSGTIVVREDRASGERTLVATTADILGPVALARGALVFAHVDGSRRLRAGTGVFERLAIPGLTIAGDGDAAYIEGWTSGRTDGIHRVTADDASLVFAPPEGQRLERFGVGGGGVYGISIDGCSPACVRSLVRLDRAQTLAELPSDGDAGPLATDGLDAFTSVGSSIVAVLAGAKPRVVATLPDPDLAVQSFALASARRLFACIGRRNESASGHLVAIDAAQGSVDEVSGGEPCTDLVWSNGELFWKRLGTTTRDGAPVFGTSLGRLRTG